MTQTNGLGPHCYDLLDNVWQHKVDVSLATSLPFWGMPLAFKRTEPALLVPTGRLSQRGALNSLMASAIWMYAIGSILHGQLGCLKHM